MIRVFLVVVLLAWSSMVYATDSRFCGVVYQDISTGKIHRSTSVLNAYKKEWPCPIDCTNYQVDHIIPLACGGCDSVENMAWMHKSIKTCATTATGPVCKDRYERRVDVFCGKPKVTVYVP